VCFCINIYNFNVQIVMGDASV